jgi:thiamine-monophosphate kinase
MTLLGYAERERILQRGTARAGDDIYVSGTIGDGALGLKVLRQDLTGLPETQATFLSERYRLPRPRVGLGWRLAEQGLATAAIDISDGLAADLGHICATSGLAAEVEVNRVPLSPATETALKREPRLLGDVLGGGDDYELMFTAAPSARDDLRRLSEALNLPLSRIGTMVDGEGVRLRNAAGNVVSLDRSGWTHF